MNKVIQFLREAYAELIRVTWPTRSQTIQYTILVVIISLGVAAFLGALDYVFGIGVKDYLLGTPEPVISPAIDGAEGINIDSGTVVPVDGEISGEVQADTEQQAEAVVSEQLSDQEVNQGVDLEQEASVDQQ